MKAAVDSGAGEPVSEMAIVDTFTRLIFAAQDGFNSREELIIQALRVVDTHVALDDYRDIGEYLRALEVAEMIELVTRVQANLAGTLLATATTRASSAHGGRASR
jgi:hypothetical protein